MFPPFTPEVRNLEPGVMSKFKLASFHLKVGKGEQKLFLSVVFVSAEGQHQLATALDVVSTMTRCDQVDAAEFSWYCQASTGVGPTEHDSRQVARVQHSLISCSEG